MKEMDYSAEEIKQLALSPVGFWPRFLATVIDSVLILLVTGPALLAIYGKEYFQSDKLIHGEADFLISHIFPMLAVITFWIWKSATPGKMVIGVKIVDAKTLGKPSSKQYIGRYFAYFLSALPLALGFLWVAFDRRKQGWHDKLAGTLVIESYD